MAERQRTECRNHSTAEQKSIQESLSHVVVFLSMRKARPILNLPILEHKKHSYPRASQQQCDQHMPVG
jgi:hypothetical protein